MVDKIQTKFEYKPSNIARRITFTTMKHPGSFSKVSEVNPSLEDSTLNNTSRQTTVKSMDSIKSDSESNLHVTSQNSRS